MLVPVYLEISFVDLLGKNPDAMSEEVRRARWEEWKKLDAEAASYWDPEGCEGCIHLDGDWCKLQELPASVNPFLSYGTGMPGMACMGISKDTGEPQERDEASDIPF